MTSRPEWPLAEGHDGGLWLAAEDAARVAGWETSSDGACRGARCVPLPPGAVAGDGAVDLVALARHLGEPVLHDASHGVWLIGDEPDGLRDRLSSLEAPDFTLPDIGRRPCVRGSKGEAAKGREDHPWAVVRPVSGEERLGRR